jgi:hypothetical protein
MSGILDRSPLFIADFRPQTVNGLLQCENFGRAGGAPRYCVLGDGSTANTIPVPNASGRFGASFTGTQYVNTGIVDRYEWNQQFSLYALVTSISTTGFSPILSSQNVGNAYRGIMLALALYSGISSLDLELHNAFPGTRKTIYTPLGGGVLTSSITDCNSAQPAMYANGVTKIYTTAMDTLGGNTVKSGYPFFVGMRANGLVPVSFATGIQIYAVGIFDGLLTPRSISELDNLVRSKITSW